MATLDRLSPLLDQFRVRARVFHTGPLCGVTTFAAVPGRGFLHVLREGTMTVTHRTLHGELVHTAVTEPSVLFYPRPHDHDFHNAPTAESDFACAALEFEGGSSHPLARALPTVTVLPLRQVDGLEQSLHLLFSEIDQLRCGQRLLADRLFEVVLLQLLRWILDNPTSVQVPPGLLTGLSDPQLARTLLALHESPGHDWNLASMARMASMSRSTFASRFKAVVGETPNEYLTSWRLTLAQLRLSAGKSVKATSAELGYANASALSRVFTQRFGQSPTAWLASSAAA